MTAETLSCFSAGSACGGNDSSREDTSAPAGIGRRRRPWFHVLPSLCGLALIGHSSAGASVLVPVESDWRWVKGLSEASVPMDAWRALSFDDVNWAVGQGPFHYGESVAGGTVLSDMRNRYSSVFLRKAFEVESPVEVRELLLSAICDDGFIAWINGVEVARFNLPGGERPFDRFAFSAVAEPVSFAAYDLPKPVFLNPGRNLLAVQVFNSSLNSSDLRWDAELRAVEPDADPPLVASVEPPQGSVERLTDIVIEFTEPVTGVQASDLQLGSRRAIAVAGSGSRYTFTFEPTEIGTAALRWDADTLIMDMASPANVLDPETSGPWLYEVVDRTPPRLVEIAPHPGAVIRSLSQIELRFSEPVEGADAADLLVNGTGAAKVTGALAGPYRFEFGPLPAGEIHFSWPPVHGICDMANPANSFVGEEWRLELDPDYVLPALRINEFLASSVAGSGIRDEDGELQDWIEIYNEGRTLVNLEGWSLTDDRKDPGRWTFPGVALGPGEFLVVFASGKDRRPSGGTPLHTNFKLSPTGEYLGIFNHESPRTLVSDFGASFPEQRNDYSYGFDSAQQLGYFRAPTPGRPNGVSSVQGVVLPPHVNISRGWFDAPFTLHVTSPLPGATLRFTTDGSEPTEVNGETYSQPLRITATTTFRVAAFKPDMLPSLTSTHTYLFPKDVLSQPNNPPGFPAGPSAWAGFPSDYEMDPEIVNDPRYGGSLEEALLALPALSIVCRTADLFDANEGIYIHPTSRGPAWERPCSVEFIPSNGAAGFQTAAGMQVQGNAAREPRKQPKHPLRLVFKGDYGPRRLEFPLFPDTPITDFDTLILRADFNFSWLHWNPHQRILGQRTRDAWMKDSMRAMGGLATHNRYVHLFLNGLYWGVYDPSERPDGAFAASYLGGEKEDYDVVNEGAAVDGNKQAYNAMLAITDLANPAAYAQMRQLLDLDQFIDYMLLHFYAGHQDWGNNKNWYTFRPKDGSRGFLYLPWDGEMILDDINHNRVASSDTPSELHTKLLANTEYQLAFADRAHRHLFHNGALTPTAVEARWLQRANEVELPIIAESARWGDYRRDVHSYQSPPYQLYTRDGQYRTEQERLLNQYFPGRTAVLLDQLRAAGLYPQVAAPEFNQSAGHVQPGSSLTLRATEGQIYFTTDGADPRRVGTGGLAAGATAYSGPFFLNTSVRLKARALHQGVWSALAEADFRVGEVGLPLRITEIMYHPVGGDGLEFVEIQNVGNVPIDAGGYSLGGIQCVFPHGTVLRPGQVFVLASGSSPALFTAQYPGAAVAGYFQGNLSNGGERLELRDGTGRSVTAVTYDDSAPWPDSADGEGSSLEVLDPLGNPSAPANWQASVTAGGSPGKVPLVRGPGAVRLNEVMARAAPNSAAGEDWIELANVGTADISVAGWSMADESAQRFVFAPGAVLPANGYLVVWCDGRTNADDFHAPFRLAQGGETVTLYDVDGRRIDAVTFGSQVAGFGLGRVGNAGDWELVQPTPAAPNTAAALAQSTNLRMNEWLANPRPGDDDWIEIYNADPLRPAALGDLMLATPTGLFPMQPLSFIAPGEFARLLADGNPGFGHVEFKLPAGGGFFALLNPNGAEIDRIAYGPQLEGISEGRLPDGAPAVVQFPDGATPGESNAALMQSRVLLNEILASDRFGAGWIELHNSSEETIDLASHAIVLDDTVADSWPFPMGSHISAFGYLVVQFDPAQAPSTEAAAPLQSGLSLGASRVVSLRNPSGRLLDLVEFGFQCVDQSMGLSDGAWRLLAKPTPGTANTPAAALGSVTALRINEWLASPASGGDWVELFNAEAQPVRLDGLFLTDDPALGGQSQFQVGPLSFVGPGAWVVWKADSAPGDGPDHTSFSLNQLGEALRVYSWDGALIDAVDFGLQQNGLSEGRLVDGGPDIGPLLNGPTQGRSNAATVENADQDGDGLPDVWEVTHGTDPSAPDADADPDHDGLTNQQEFLAGTIPTDPNSSLKVLNVAVGPETITFQFQSMPERTYSLLWQQTLGDPEWRKLADVPALHSSRLREVQVPTNPNGIGFYRLIMPAEPQD